MKDNTDILNSYCRIRKLIGILGLLLPFIIYVFYGSVLPSISHYYYTRSAVFFIAILAAFGFFLISYRGYENKSRNKKLCHRFSDNTVTHIGGVAILLVILIPTDCIRDLSICQVCQPQGFCLFGHKDELVGAVHLISAAIFFIAMGYMSLCNFTRGNDKKYHRWYKRCGGTIFIALGLLIIEFIIKIFVKDFQITPYDVYILETVMVVAFAVSWLLKGRTIEYVGDMLNSLFKHKRKEAR